jgi:hypothetical protein
MPPLVNRTFELPVTRPKGPSVLQQLRDRDPKATSATPLIVSHSSGLSLAYIEASVYSEANKYILICNIVHINNKDWTKFSKSTPVVDFNSKIC